ncbi:Uncharacterised protein [Legionella lansingensis]|uniref:Uncharacterized protein n=1 Tax=Legionella lansingensis TaxID=45067 RepID=A0A0W0VPW7_9GAMM|nr:hypothetical protein [Legionella lansingensis]KTD22183.1 hypothetical protein Llan_1446 [Legionella lansingensis]SNV54772.1 Uncharacterised protein [Legionella lansingensis]
MFEKAAEVLTWATGGLVDPFNIGGLARQRTRETFAGLWTHYSWREYFARGTIVVSTVACAMLAANSCENEDCSYLARGMAGAAFGFFASHVAVMTPTLLRRNAIKKDSQALCENVGETLNKIAEKYNSETEPFEVTVKLIVAINNFATAALNQKLPVTKRGDTVKNLLSIKSLMRKLDASVQELASALLEADNDSVGELLQNALVFWEQDFDMIKADLMAMDTVQMSYQPKQLTG